MPKDLTSGSIARNMAAFAGPYLIACFLQTFYPVADLFIAGLYNGASTLSAISIGGQVMHFLVMLIAGIAMGANVCIGKAFGERDDKALSQATGNAIIIFTGLAVVLTAICIPCTEPIIGLLQTPEAARNETVTYTQICFLGIPFIAAYNLIASIYRGLGDTRFPLLFVAIGGCFNIALDIIFIGQLGMGATGAAAATVIAQGVSVAVGILCLCRMTAMRRPDMHPRKAVMRAILGIGLPILCQDGFVQVGFLVITAIANSRGLYVSAAVGIVEKIICFFFLVPSAMLASVSAVSAQNRGAGLHARSRQALKYGLITCCVYGGVIAIVCQPLSPALVGLFTSEQEVIRLGAQYLRTYSFDVAAAGAHFCFSGFFCAYSRSIWSFIHNAVSICAVRIPGTWLASVLFPATLYEMGIVTPLGSVVSVVICILVFRHYRGWWDHPDEPEK
ncbi:MAG: MATE family efflux transporter [Proteobacteria bacterium]|nr:MATE family efflux transporter [Pseudomonadota bacterium]